MPTNCSFRITRSAEDLAKTISILSQRVIHLENRIKQLESSNQQNEPEESYEQIQMLESVEQIMNDCREMLEPHKTPINSNQNLESETIDDIFAA